MPRRPSARAVLRLLPKLALGLALALVVAELGLRLLLFSDWVPFQKLGWSQRQAWLYADNQAEDLHWALRHRFGQLGSDVSPTADPRVGWRRAHLIQPETYAHREMSLARGRRPVLMFGDSYTQCTTKRADCWKALLDESPLAGTHAIVNYGVNAYGLDQVTLLMEPALDWAASLTRISAPVIVVGIMVDDDLDRTDLRLREWPKPHFEVAGNELILSPPAELDRGAWVEAFDGWPLSYLWRRVTRSRSLPTSVRRVFWTPEDHRVRVTERVPLLLDRIQAQVGAHGFETFFLLFPGPTSLIHSSEPVWQEQLLVLELEARGLRFENARDDFTADIEATGRQPADYFGTEGAGIDHYNRLGNEVALRALVRGLGSE